MLKRLDAIDKKVRLADSPNARVEPGAAAVEAQAQAEAEAAPDSFSDYFKGKR